MMTRPSMKMLALLAAGGLALAVALGAAAALPGASSTAVPAVLLALGAVAAVVSFWFALAAQGRRERSTVQKVLSRHLEQLDSRAGGLSDDLTALRADQVADGARIAALESALERVSDSVKAEGAAARVNFAALTEDLAGARHDVSGTFDSFARDTRESLTEALGALRAQDLRTKDIAGVGRRLQVIAEAGDSRQRKVLNLLRAESRERAEAGSALAGDVTEIRDAISSLPGIEGRLGALGDRVAEAGRNSADTGVAVRRVQNYLRKEGNIQIVLDRLIASERRTLGALETTRWEFGDELARAAEAHEAHRDDSREQLSALRDDLTERDRAREEVDRARGDEVGSALGGLRELIAVRFDEQESAGAERGRARAQSLDSTLHELRQSITQGLSSLETAGGEWAHGVLDRLDGIASAGDRTAEQSSSIAGDIDAVRADVARLENFHGDAARGIASELEAVHALRADLEDRVKVAGAAVTGDAEGSGTSVVAALGEAVERIKTHVESSAKSHETELRRFVLQMNDRTHRHLKRETIEGVRQTEALLQLVPRVDTIEHRFPATGWWALSADTVLYLSDYILERRPKRILEIGSGASTIWLGTFAQRIGAQYVSIEHDESFAAHTRSMIDEHGLAETVDLRHAPLTPLAIDGEEFSWYDRAAFEDIGDGFDLLVVDGPPEATGDMARYPAMPVLADRLAPDATVVLDDVHREAEAESLRRWSEAFEGYETVQTGLSRTGMMQRRTHP